MSTDQRSTVRNKLQCQVVVATKHGSCITQLDNLSTAGCCIEKPSDWDFSPNDVLNLYLIINNEYVIDAEAMFIWADDKRIGLQYLHAQGLPVQFIEEMQ